MLYREFLAKELAALPGSPVVVVDGSPGALRRTGFQSPHAAVIVEAPEMPFGQYLRLDVANRTKNGWDVQVMSLPSTAAVRKGDHVMVAMTARCVLSADESGSGSVTTYFNRTSPWKALLSATYSPSSEWKTYYAHAVAEEDFAAGACVVDFHLGHFRQVVDIGGVYVVNFGSDVDAAQLPRTVYTYRGREADAPWRIAAQDRIRAHRMAPLGVKVVNAEGKPLEGVSVKVTQQSHAYRFGTFVDHTVRGDGDAARYREFVGKYFNQVTLPLYWNWIWVNPENRDSALKDAQVLKDMGKRLYGHAMIWPDLSEHHDKTPAQVRALRGNPAALKKAIEERIRETLRATRSLGIAEWDLVNEPRDFHDMMKVLGEDIVGEWFSLADKVAPDIEFNWNENQILTNGGVTQSQQENYKGWIQRTLDSGAKVGGIGFQGHMSVNMTPPERVYEILDNFARFGVSLHVTEFDITTEGDLQLQADYTRDFLTIVFSHPATESFCFWGFWEATHWRPGAELVTRDWQIRPNGQAFIDLVYRDWWTEESLVTDGEGQVTTRAFLGDYLIEVCVNGKTISRNVTLNREGYRKVWKVAD